MERTAEAGQVYELSDSSGDELVEQNKQSGSSTAQEISPRDAGSLQKKQRLQSSCHRGEGSTSAAPPPPRIAASSVLLQPPTQAEESATAKETSRTSRKQFWKAADYEGQTTEAKPSVGIERGRVHPKFLHANATCHTWALGAIAELVDNAMDEIANGATFVDLEVCTHPRHGSAMLVVEDDGGGMNPSKVRQCMSFGYTMKSKNAEAIGQYGNGFKTSTMRLGADVIVFSRSPASSPSLATQSIGMLSFTFLRETGQEDVLLPMIDYELSEDRVWRKRNSFAERWDRNMKTIQTWSPYITEKELLDQFVGMKDHGTKIVLYNLWEDDQGQPELDFEYDPYDVQVRGPNRDEEMMSKVQRFPHSRHYLTYQHSLRSYLSILYLRRPTGFKIILRGQQVPDHKLVDDLMHETEHTYKPQTGDSIKHGNKEVCMEANVVLGFSKDAKNRVNLQGFNVYHKNRLIKPFWKVWNTSDSRGRGIVGVLEANFVVPAHDKQGLEKSLMASRLETRLLQMQKAYWAKNCHKVGYVGYANNQRPSFQSSPLPTDVEVLNCGGQASASMGSPNSNPRVELQLSSTRSLGNGSPLGAKEARVEIASSSEHRGGPSLNPLMDLGRTSGQRAAGPSESHAGARHGDKQHPPSTSNELVERNKDEIIRRLKAERAEILAKVEKLEEARKQKLMNVKARNTWIEAKLLEEPQNRAATRRHIEEIIRGRDELQTRREKERLRPQRIVEPLEMAELRLAELDSENRRLQSS